MSGPAGTKNPMMGRRYRRSLKRRSLKILLDLMGREQTPERVAAAVALGVGVGLSPFIGFHFILAIVLAFAFRLNKLDTVLGSLVGNPWTLPPFFAAGYRVGRALLGYSSTRVAPLHWQRILHEDFWVAFRGPGFGPRLAAFLVGTTLLAAATALVTYVVLRGMLRVYHRRHPRVAERAARRRAISERPSDAASPLPPEPLPPDHRVH